jgi:curved DNA-binding protein CbpA
VTLEEARSELELTSRASAADVRRAFKKLALLHHPDRNQGRAEATARFRRVLLAYEILSGQRAPSLGDRPASASARPKPAADARPFWAVPFVEALPIEDADGEPIHYPTPDEIRKLDVADPVDPRKMMDRALLFFIGLVALWWLLALLDPRPPPPNDPLRDKQRRNLGTPW